MTIPCCGPKCSAFCAIISFWGIIMLALLGVFFYIEAPALAEDLPIKEDEWAEGGHNYTYISKLYKQVAYNCWIATGMYGATFIFSCIMFKLNMRSGYSAS